MKPPELRNMTKEELNQKTAVLKEELSKLLFKYKTGTLDKSARISQVRQDIARIKTIMKEGSYAK
jgi:large subunit ribosomal protein L29